MDKALEYTHAMINFDSAYNTSSNFLHQPTKSVSMFSSTNYTPFSNRSSSPLFRRCTSPPPRQPILKESGPKFNFDLYTMDENKYDSDDIYSLSNDSISASPSRTIYQHELYSPQSSPKSQSKTLSKLKQFNDELWHTIVEPECINRPPAHYHIHHYPLSQHPYQPYRSRSKSSERSSLTEIEVSPEIHKARVTYRVHVPQKSHRSSRHVSLSNANSDDDPVMIDLYPTRDHGFTKHNRKYTDKRSSWLVQGISIRRNSYSNANTRDGVEESKGLYYGDKPIKTHRHPNHHKEHAASGSCHESSYLTSRIRAKATQLYPSEEYQESNTSFSGTSSPRQIRRSTKKNNLNDSHIPSSKSKLPIHDAKVSHKTKEKSHNESVSSRTEHDESTRKHTVDETESEPISQRKPSSNRTKVRNGNHNPKKHSANTDNKENSTWEPTVTSLSTPTMQNPKPTVNINTSQHSSSNVSTESKLKSKSRNQLRPNETNDNIKTSLENESQLSERSKKQDSPHSPPHVEKLLTPQKEQRPLIEPTKPSVNNNAIIHDNDAKLTQDNNSRSSPTSKNNKDQNCSDSEESSHSKHTEPTPTASSKEQTSERKTPPSSSPQAKHPNNQNDRDGNDEEVARSFDIDKWLKDASKSILGPSKENDNPPPVLSLPKPKVKTPPRRKQRPPSPAAEDSDNLYKPPFGPKRKDKQTTDSSPSVPLPQPTATTTTTTTAEDNAVDDFFS